MHDQQGKHVRRVPAVLALVLAALIAPVVILAAAQRGGGQQPPATPPPATPQASAPLDLTGYWVSVVTEDWRWRMLTPPKGDAPGVPLSREGRRVADTWDLVRDNATGNQCKAFGVGGIMRQPGRIHITWQDEQTLRMDFDAGKQTRLIHMGNVPHAARAEPSLQGTSLGQWQLRTTGAPILEEEGRGRGGRGGAAGQIPKGSLKVVTTGMRAGYFRKNGLPYSETATITEYFDRHDDYGSEWFTVLTVIDDPKYLVSPFVTTTHFKREATGAKFNPQPCETLPPSTTVLSKGEN
jgi:hypothetical protein